MWNFRHFLTIFWPRTTASYVCLLPGIFSTKLDTDLHVLAVLTNFTEWITLKVPFPVRLSLSLVWKLECIVELKVDPSLILSYLGFKREVLTMTENTRSLFWQCVAGKNRGSQYNALSYHPYKRTKSSFWFLWRELRSIRFYGLTKLLLKTTLQN